MMIGPRERWMSRQHCYIAYKKFHTTLSCDAISCAYFTVAKEILIERKTQIESGTISFNQR